MDCLAEACWPALRKINLGLTAKTEHDMIGDGLLLTFSKLKALDLSHHNLSEVALQQWDRCSGRISSA